MLRNRKHAREEEVIPEQDVDVTAVQHQLDNAKPLVAQVARVVNTVGPVAEQAIEFLHQQYLRLSPYHPEKMIPALAGVFLLFAGGSYMTIIAAFEAFRVTGGWAATEDAVQMLYRNYKATKEANAKDNTVDENNDGIADVLQINERELVTRKLLLVAKTVDPMEIQSAYNAIAMAFLAVIATIKVRFAEALTLGATLGEMIERAIAPYASPALKKLMPAEYHRWVPVIISLSTKSIGISIAYSVMRFIAALYTSVRGAYLLVGGLLFYAKEVGWLNSDTAIHTASLLYNVAQIPLAVIGAWYQISSGYSVPFPLSVLLFPLDIAEGLLKVWVAYS